jgi:hypothetical protein
MQAETRHLTGAERQFTGDSGRLTFSGPLGRSTV